MSGSPSTPTPVRRRQGAARAYALAYWLLVLVLAFDHLSAPFHTQHRHEGVGVQDGAAAIHAVLDNGVTHAHGDDHPLFSHAAIAIRSEPRRWNVLDAPVTAGLHAVAPKLAAFGVVDEHPSLARPPERSRPIGLSYRSLPPMGRAPPLLA